MIMTAPFSAALSEQWLLERTYHAQLRNGGELSVPKLTHTMKQITSFYVPLSTWREIPQEEARAAPQQGIPVLLYESTPGSIPKVPPKRGARIKTCASSFLGMPECSQR